MPRSLHQADLKPTPPPSTCQCCPSLGALPLLFLPLPPRRLRPHSWGTSSSCQGSASVSELKGSRVRPVTFPTAGLVLLALTVTEFPVYSTLFQLNLVTLNFCVFILHHHSIYKDLNLHCVCVCLWSMLGIYVNLKTPRDAQMRWLTWCQFSLCLWSWSFTL